jgi:exonuclease SbcC
MATNHLFRSAQYRHADPARRVTGLTELPPESDELAELLATDPAPEVRSAAADRCTDLGALAAAAERENDPAVRAAVAAALCRALAQTQDPTRAASMLEDGTCTDAIRVEVARRTSDVERRRIAIAAIREETALIELALAADHAETRLAAAERVRTPEGLRKLADAARNRDHGVARLAKQRIGTIAAREDQAAEADAILAQLEALAVEPGAILKSVIELNRRWQVLDLGGDGDRLARCEAARQALQARFDREHEEQRARARFEQRLGEWLGRTDPPATPDALAGALHELSALRDEAHKYPEASMASQLDEAERRIEQWTLEFQALAGAEALVVEAEQLAAGTSIDHAKLPERWQALDRSTRTPALTRRFEAALIVVEQRRLAQIRAAEQEAQAARAHLHNLLHTAEQALAAGQLLAARAAADEVRAKKPGAGPLPKPTMQRLSRLTQQLTELERWESFGQQNARVQLCERAEAAATLGLDAPHLAAEVQKLRNEWKALDQQHAGVPKALWERFDHACERAYAPAARHFAEQAAQRKQARRQREEFIAAAAAHASTLLGEPCDWRAIERWLRETHQRWQDGGLGSVEPKAWKTFDTRLRAALSPLRDALSAARDEARVRRVALIDEVTALGAKATDRDTPGQVKAIQARWQTQAKEMALAQRDERALWEQFRAACDAVFQAREAKRKESDDRKHEGRRALEGICAELEQLAMATAKDEGDLRRALRDLEAQWKQKTRAPDPALRGMEPRFTKAKAAVDAMLAARARAREGAVWQTLAAKERLCEELDTLVHSRESPVDSAAAHERWAAQPVLPAAWEKAMLARRDGALSAAADEAAAALHRERIERDAEARSDLLLELEMQLGLECPPELAARRLALQVKKLRDRFQSAATTGTNTTGERLLAWCAQPGVTDPRDRQRRDRVFSAIERVR